VRNVRQTRRLGQAKLHSLVALENSAIAGRFHGLDDGEARNAVPQITRWVLRYGRP
jgi:hypothetical protein